jgi:RNA polymerase sigma factor (sigma-70 family)
VRTAQGGDVLALSLLMDRLAPWLARICGGIALEQAEDATQEALLQVFRDLSTLREPAALRGWARRIAVREAVRHAQRARAERGRTADGDVDRSIADAGAYPTDHVAPHAGSRAIDPGVAPDVRAVLAQLAPEQRAILVLRDLEGLSEEEAAEQLGVAKGTVKSRLFRAREAFVRRWSQ